MRPLRNASLDLDRSSLDNAPDARNLLQVHQVMSGIQPAHVLDAFFPALGVNADALQIGGGCPLEQPQVATP